MFLRPNNYQKFFEASTPTGNTPTCNAHFFHKFLTGKKLHIINLGMKEYFKSSKSLGYNSNGKKALILVKVSSLHDAFFSFFFFLFFLFFESELIFLFIPFSACRIAFNFLGRKPVHFINAIITGFFTAPPPLEEAFPPPS